ncbi:MAG: alkaline phosphatase [Flavobacteriales bacterium]|nr:alkaline phosphatase [Flavobacteriales bacterium]
MNRKDFLKGTGLLALSSAMLPSMSLANSYTEIADKKLKKKAKNIIFLVSDGMSIGTLTMADTLLRRKYGRGSNWLDLYRENKVSRALMDTSSLSSLVTDSAAASSSWGGGHKIPNGKLNIGANGEKYLPILQKFKSKGKKVGCVTTVPITHATPAGFCVNMDSRNNQDEIAEEYLKLRFDVMMGGGKEHFSSQDRKDKKDLFSEFKTKGFDVLRAKNELKINDKENPILGVFSTDGLPYSIDRKSDEKLNQQIPTLAEMTDFAINKMKGNKNGFVLQVESGRVDWAAHGNDIAGLLYDQIEFDDAIKKAIDFAEKDGETLVIVTTDHGNANPGLIYGNECNDNFDTVQNYKHSNAWILNNLNKESSIKDVQQQIELGCNYQLSDEQAKEILSYYTNLNAEGLYNPRHLPFQRLAEIQKEHNSVGWISMNHSSDFVELAMYGVGKELLPPFIQNADLHYLMLAVCGIENNF